MKHKSRVKPRSKNSRTMSKEYERAVKTMAKGAGIGFIGLLLGKAFAYLTRIFIARNLGPDAYGLISMGLAIVNILTTLCLLGLNPGLTRFIAFYMGKRRLDKVKGAIISSFKITLPISIFFSFLLFFFSKNLALFFSKPSLTLIFCILSLSLPFSVAINLFHSIFLGFKQVKQKVLTVEIGKNLSTLLFVAVLISLGFNIFGATVGFLFGFIFSFFIGTFYLINTLNPLKNTISFPVSKELIKFSYPLLLVATLSLVLSWTDVLMLGYFDTAKNVGIYSAALNTVILLNFIFQAFGIIIIPLISEFYSQNKNDEIKKMYKISTKWMFLSTLPLFLLFILFPDNVLKMLFGNSFVSGSIPFIILSLGTFFSVTCGLGRETIIAFGKTKLIFYITLASAACNVILNFVLIPIFGMSGAAVALLVAYVIWSAVPLYYLRRKVGIWPYDKNYLKIFFSSLISVGIVYCILKFTSLIDYIYMILGFITFLLLYIFIILLTRSLSAEDILILKSIEKKTGLKIKWLRNVIKRFV